MGRQHAYINGEDRIGIIVHEMFLISSKMESEQFLKLANGRWRHTDFIHLDWRNDSEKRILPLLHAKRKEKLQRPYHLDLFRFPEELYFDFLLDDLAFPLPIVGIIVSVDLSDEVIWKTIRKQDAMLTKPDRGGLAWVKAQALPFVVAATHAEEAFISLDQLRNLLDLKSTVPIIACPKGFDEHQVQTVLSALIEHIRRMGK